MKLSYKYIKKYFLTLVFFCKQDLRNIWPLTIWTIYLLIPALSHRFRKKRCKFFIYKHVIEGRIAHVGTIKEVIIEGGYFVEDLPKGDIIDIGANVGISQLLFQNIFKEGYSFFAIEPDKNNVDLLKINFPLLPVFMVAMSNKSGYVNFTSSQTGITSKIGGGQKNTESLSLNDFVLLNKLKPSLIKIDVEGAELEVLEGGREVFAEYKPTVFIEVHEQDYVHKIERFFKEIGYTTFEDKGNNIYLYQ